MPREPQRVQLQVLVTWKLTADAALVDVEHVPVLHVDPKPSFEVPGSKPKLLGLMINLWTQCNASLSRGKVLKVQWTRNKMAFSVHIVGSRDERCVRFVAILKGTCVTASDGTVYEWSRDNVLKT